MDVLKIQQEVLKAIAKGKPVHYYETDDDKVMVTITGTVGWFIPKRFLHLNLVGAQSMNPLKLDGVWCPFNQLQPTDEYRVGGTVRKYLHADEEVRETYIDQNLMKFFDDPVLYQKQNPLELIVVTETSYEASKPELVGVVFPFRIKD